MLHRLQPMSTDAGPSEALSRAARKHTVQVSLDWVRRRKFSSKLFCLDLCSFLCSVGNETSNCTTRCSSSSASSGGTPPSKTVLPCICPPFSILALNRERPAGRFWRLLGGLNWGRWSWERWGNIWIWESDRRRGEEGLVGGVFRCLKETERDLSTVIPREHEIFHHLAFLILFKGVRNRSFNDFSLCAGAAV